MRVMGEAREVRGPVCFSGDLDDSWGREFYQSLPAGTAYLGGSEGLSALLEKGFDGGAGVLVMHRQHLNAREAALVARLRAEGVCSKVVVCVGPHARYEQVQRWAGIADAVLSETTARAALPRYVREEPGTRRKKSRPASEGDRVAVISDLYEMREFLSEACRWLGYRVRPVGGPEDLPDGLTALWDVPVLGRQWPRELAIMARRNPVVAMMGFPTRGEVQTALDGGAMACLELPCDPEDLGYVLDRMEAAVQVA